MISYATPASIKAANAEADRIMAQHAASPFSHVKPRSGPSRETPDDVRKRAGDKVPAVA